MSLNGFFLYLGTLDVIGVEPNSALTGTYYVVLGTAMLVAAWPQRATLRERFQRSGRLGVVFVAAGAALAVLFLASVALVSEGDLARRLAGQLVFWTIPTVLLAASLSRRQLEDALRLIVVLGVIFVGIELVTLADDPGVDRFSPFVELDPITAAHIPALAAVCWLATGGARWRSWVGLVVLAMLVAGAFLPGSRGPLFALTAGLAALFVLTWRTTGFRALGAVAVGVVAGLLLASQAGSTRHLVFELDDKKAQGTSEPISSLKIRERLIRKAVGDVPEKPLFGHGVGMLIDDTPEAHRMGIAGRRTYPHNNFVEAAYSLGLVGLALFAASIAAALWAFVRLVRRRRGDRLAVFAAAFFVFAFANANVSGELAAYAWSWTAAALVIALLVARPRAEAT